MTFQHVLFPPFHLDLANNLLWRGEQVVSLRPKAMKVLRHLIEQRGQVVSQDEIFQTVWSNTVVSSGGLKVCIREIRQVLRDDAKTPQFIETVPGQGYRFIAPVVSRQNSLASSKKEARDWRLETSPFSSQATSLTPQVFSVVEREEELAKLHDWLEHAREGARQIVFVTGEPGTGKTTLVDAFIASLVSDSSLWVAHGQCVEHYGSGEPYLPMLEALEGLCLEPGHEWLLPLLRQYAPLWLAQLPSLLSHDERVTLQRELLGTTQERMLREMASLIETLTGTRVVHEPPLLVLVLEDLHWSDASTVELIARLARRQDSARLLLIGTYRPIEVLVSQHPLHGLYQELQGHEQCQELPLSWLSEEAVSTYLHRRFPHQLFPQQLTLLLHQRTEGNPLLLVSVMEEWVAQGLLKQEEGTWILANGIEAIKRKIPHSVRQLIEKQIERLSAEEQQALAAASVAGAEFSAAAVAAALERDVVAVEACCEELARRQQFLRQAGVSAWPDGTVATRYGFRHALSREAWYERTTFGQRQRLHQRIGKRLEIAFRDQANEIVAELAMHFEEAQDYRRAVEYHKQAGEKALQRFAYHETIVHFTTALELLKLLPDTPERAQQELTLQLALGGPLSATKGWAAPETGQAYARALDLGKRTGNTTQLFLALFGSWVFAYTRAELRTAHALAQQLLQLAQDTQDRALLMEAHHALGNTLHRQGELTAARTYLEQGIALYDRRRHASHATLYGLDDGVAGLGYTAWVLWSLGYPDHALQRSREMLALAKKISHPLSQAWALNSAAWHYQFRREAQKAKEWAEAEIALCTEHGFSQLLAVGTIVQGWALAAQGQGEEGIRQIHEGMAAVQNTGTAIGRSRYLATLAEMYGKLGQAGVGLPLLAEALLVVEHGGERFYEAELYRLRGQLTLQKFQVPGSKFQITDPRPLTPDPQVEAEECFRRAVAVARRQKAKLLELRAVMNLSRLWQGQGKQKKARQTLAGIYAWFTEGFDSVDVQEAKALLDELA
jgi:DNA-binding winged helix-turn-helix (wHTH) protein/predicted ATPase